jgi:hypothetical protein
VAAVTIADEIRYLIDDVRDRGLAKVVDMSTAEIQTQIGERWIAVVLWLTPKICRHKDRSHARLLHDLAGRYQTRPQEGWSAPDDWDCWKGE